MDSLTQIVLGAAVGEAVLGKHIGNKAMVYGAISGTIPDLDIFASLFTDTVTALSVHRGFTHSILFSVLASPILAWLVCKYETYKNFKSWTLLFFWGFLTHSILDAHTTWGTQLFWPFDLRLAFKTIFVIDPLYTLPFLMFLILAMFKKRTSKKRRFYNSMGLVVSSCYLALTFILKCAAFEKFEDALQTQGITYNKLDTRPAPLNTILWSANVDTEKAYLLGNYSFFDTQPINFDLVEKKHELLGNLIENEKVKQMIAVSEGWYTVSKKNGSLFFNDLRFGRLSLEPKAQDFVFQYEIRVDKFGSVQFIEQKKTQRDGKKLLGDLWLRLKGN